MNKYTPGRKDAGVSGVGA